MKRKTQTLAATLLYIMLSATLAVGAGTTFTDVAQNPNSGLYNSDFSAGTAVFDFNNDGLDDIVVNNYYTPNRLYMSNGNGTFNDVGEIAGVSMGPHTLGIATADLDASGYMDFLVFAENRNPGFLYMNNGNGTFSDAYISEFSIATGYDGYAAAFADVDRDGLLDVFYAGRLFRNLGNLTFVEINGTCGLGNLAFVAHACFGDIDNDNDPDLFIARQAGSAALFLNDGMGNFTNITSRIEGSPYGLCGTFGDIDSDGDLDLFVSYSNRMYFNDGNGYFTLNTSAGTYHRYTRGAVFADFDNDGDPDLVLGNEDGSSTYHENRGNGLFVDVTDEVGMDNQQQKAGGVAVGDFDHDGDLDIYIAKTNYLINPCFFNNLNNNNAIVITPKGTVSNSSGIGSKVYLYAGNHLGDLGYLVGMAELTSTSGFHAGTTGRVHLGTGGPGQFDVRVIFPSGAIVDTSGVNAGSRLVIYESGDIPNYLYVSPGNISITENIGDGPQSVSLSLSDSKGEGVAWTAVASESWIALHSSAGTTPSTLGVTVDPTGLGLGQYSGTITITAPEAFNSPVVVHAALNLTDNFFANVSSTVGVGHADFTLGGAFFDYDNDGFDDIFVNNMFGNCRLYHSDGSGFVDEAYSAGVSAAYHNLGVFGGDLNADDLPDILAFTEDRTVGFTYLNTGFGTFSDAGISLFSTAHGYDGYAANAADIDNDGDLDVFYGARLYRNDGYFTFTDITDAAGLTGIRFVCRALFGDIDNDNDADLFINRQNCAESYLFRNNGSGYFENISNNSSLGYFPTALGTSFGDVDADGDLDMYLGAGFAYPNYLLLNDGSGYFTDVTGPSGTSCTNYTRGTDFFDADNDGDLDLVVANENRSSQLFLNDGTGKFSDVTDQCGINDGLAKAAQSVVGDYDQDGDLDIYIGRTDNIINSLFKNLINNDRFITVKPVGIVSNRAGVGAKCYLYQAGQIGNPDALFAYRYYNISNGFSGSGANYVHFGTGTETLFDLRVIFPSGIVVDQAGVTPGSRLTVIESGEIPDYLVLIPVGFNFEFDPGDPAQQGDLTIRNSAGNPIAWTAAVDAGWCQLSSSSGTTDQTITVTADPSGLSPGAYEAHITVTAPEAMNSPRTAVVRMTIKSDQPVLALSTHKMEFVAEYNGFNPWPQEFAIVNVGAGTLLWTLETTGEPWLSASPVSGTAPASVQVSCVTGGLVPGIYTATVTVTAPGAINSPAEVEVTFEITPGTVPTRDTVRVASAATQPGSHIELPVYLYNIEDIAAFSIPLAFDPDVMTCDSVSFTGTRIEYVNVKEAVIDTTNGRLLFGMVIFLESNLPPGQGEIARLFFTVNPDAEEQVTTVDSAFFPPAGDFLLFDYASHAIVPEFVRSNIFIALEMRGDPDGNGTVNLGDAVFLINYIFKGQRPPVPEESGDANSDSRVNIGDVVYLIKFIFHNGPPPGNSKPVAPRDPVYYTVEQVATRTGPALRLLLDTDIPLGGLQFDILDPGGFLTLKSPETGELASGMRVQYGYTGRTHRYGICDMEGTGMIMAGHGVVFQVAYSGYDDIRLESLRIFDDYGNECPLKYGDKPNTEAVPQYYSLAQNYPNPFNPATIIEYITAKPGHVELVIFNVLGQRVTELVREYQDAGEHSVTWDGTDKTGDQVATGIYFYRLKTEDFTQTRKMALIK